MKDLPGRPRPVRTPVHVCIPYQIYKSGMGKGQRLSKYTCVFPKPVTRSNSNRRALHSRGSFFFICVCWFPWVSFLFRAIFMRVIKTLKLILRIVGWQHSYFLNNKFPWTMYAKIPIRDTIPCTMLPLPTCLYLFHGQLTVNTFAHLSI